MFLPKPRSGGMFIESRTRNDVTAPSGAACLLLSPINGLKTFRRDVLVAINIALLTGASSRDFAISPCYCGASFRPPSAAPQSREPPHVACEWTTRQAH